MAKREWTLAPPQSLNVELFDRARDVNGNPTAHYLFTWSNGRTGREWDGGSHRTRRRVQVGYRDKASGGAIGVAMDLFPGTFWRLVPDSLSETREGATLQLERDREAERVPVIFREDREHKGLGVAFFPTEAWDRTGRLVTSYAICGEHGGASPEYYRERTRPASPEIADRLRAVLEARAYRLDVRKRWTPQMDEKRAAMVAAEIGESV